MSISLHRAFEVGRPVDDVWRFLTDPRCIAGCMPGAHLLDIEGGTFTGEVDLRLGPLGTTLAGEAGFLELDATRRSVLMQATAGEVKGDGIAHLRMRSRLSELDESLTSVDVLLGVQLAGRLDGPVVSRVLTAAAEILLRRFSACVRHRLEAGAVEEAGWPAP
ncbi:MAG: SRPBCC domain-containing protein [Candidatus Palauibacterales bacterium]|nr:SRPBCC domain-containing protein [Candidatus Palauibacterales bacterium]MDP2483630.1 SRPBCC domain-containing protein [Candidatus Palauibacterales bacterium]